MIASVCPEKKQERRAVIPTGRGIILLLALALGLLATLPYLHGIDNDFIRLDDDVYVYENSQVRRGLTWEGAGWAVTTFHEANWHPLTWLSHMVDVSLFGVDSRWHHLVNILLHAFSTALIFVALFRLTASLWPSAFVASLFGVHPLHVESIAWVAERKDLLAGFFFMLILLAYERYARRGGLGRLAAVTLLLALGLMTKPMLVTVPFVLLLLDLWPLGRTSWVPPNGGGNWFPQRPGKLLLEKTPLFTLSLASSVVTFLAQREGGAVISLAYIPPVMRVANAAISYTTYLGKTVWPSGLAIFYPYPLQWELWRILGSVLLLVVLSWTVLTRFRHAPFLTVGWLWFLGMLVPVIGLVQVGDQARADRYTYLPLVGVFIGIAWVAPRILPARLKRPAVLGMIASSVVVLLAVASWVQVGWWKDSETLFTRTLSLTSDNWLIEDNLGVELEQKGRSREAIVHYREALRIWPNYPDAHNNLGKFLLGAGKIDEAMVHFRVALRFRPDFPEAHNNLGNALITVGKIDEGIVHHRQAIHLRPDLPKIRYNLGAALLITGKPDEAMIHFREALRLQPDYPKAHNNLGNALICAGKPDEAMVHFREAIRLQPDFVEAHERLAILLRQLGRHDEAQRHFEEAMRLRRPTGRK